jgi:hypothetical protein
VHSKPVSKAKPLEEERAPKKRREFDDIPPLMEERGVVAVPKGTPSLIKLKAIMPRDAPSLMEKLKKAVAPIDTPSLVPKWKEAVVPVDTGTRPLMHKKKKKASLPRHTDAFETLADLLEHVRSELAGHAMLTEARAGSFTLATRGDAVITVTDRQAVDGKVTVTVENLALLRATVLKEERMADSRVLVTLRGARDWVTGEHVGGTDAVQFKFLKYASVTAVLKVLVEAGWAGGS